ncbi:xylulose kinase [Bifidobacterium ramosum]|uniref:Xylulose kinase n=1 Tax=Bifidobacterium ramosum TaxID=1798158 RepID=A0A6L4WXL0_9BIFI|nr:FGGY family carbohydrate kinase [Bifidobacterium ramosum]KAB8286971.1 xylulose kinase [Bifidobacterium ramosum]NEG72521.1 xylulose kinase [Bifidobacterium ramosum]
MTSRVLVAGIDTSTQSTKVRVTDAATGTLVRFGQAPHPDGTSCDPNAWWNAFLAAKDQAGGLDDVAALAVGGQQHGMVLLDRQGRVVRDALLWNDTRSAPDAERLITELGTAGKAADGSEDDLADDPVMRGRQRWVRAVGSSLVASLTITKIAWVAANEPDNARHVAAVCLPHDWLSWRIAGHGPVTDNESADLDALFTDRSDASGTGYFDSATNEYRMDLFRLAFGRDDVILPRVLGPTEMGAVADPAIAGKNVPDGCVIAPGGGDNAMASLGLSMGVGDVSISLGTSGVAAAISPVPAYDMTASVTGFADCTGHWLPLACTINGSRIADAARNALGVGYDELADLAAQSVPGAHGVTLIPYFDGERTPNRPDATATLHGMTLHNTTRANIARAFVEALLCSQRDCLELVKGLGVDVKRILLIGGGAKSSAVRAYAPSILGMDVLLPKTDEYVAIGAARQAAWVLDGAAEPPAWELTIEDTLTGEPTPNVYAQYVRYRG